MRVQKSAIYIGNIKCYQSIEECPVTYGYNDCDFNYRIAGEKMSVNGERELLIRVGEYFITVRDVKGDFHLWNLLRCFTKDGKLNFDKVNERNRELIIPKIPEVGVSKFIKDEKEVFKEAKGFISLTELQDLRIRAKYTSQVTKSEIEEARGRDDKNAKKFDSYSESSSSQDASERN